MSRFFKVVGDGLRSTYICDVGIGISWLRGCNRDSAQAHALCLNTSYLILKPGLLWLMWAFHNISSGGLQRHSCSGACGCPGTQHFLCQSFSGLGNCDQNPLATTDYTDYTMVGSKFGPRNNLSCPGNTANFPSIQSTVYRSIFIHALWCIKKRVYIFMYIYI